MKKIGVKFWFVFVCFIIFSIIFSSCQNASSDNYDNSNETYDYIELNMDNYEYYLTFNSVKTDSGSLGAGTYRYAYYNLNISGAVNGLYVDCIIYYNDNKSSIKLNAAGCAQTQYSIVNGVNSFIISKVEGKIYL